jgi:hypothetical protein
MKEILPGVFHWTTFHEGIGDTVHSYLITATNPQIAIDPRVPKEGLDSIARIAHPRLILLTNRLHYRHSGRFARYFKAKIYAHRAGAQAFGPRRHKVHLFEHGARLRGGVLALKVGALCPEETAFYFKIHGGILSLADAVIRVGKRLQFVPDGLMGEDPEGVKRGLSLALSRFLRLKFRHLLFAHGEPILREGKKELADFLGRKKNIKKMTIALFPERKKR